MGAMGMGGQPQMGMGAMGGLGGGLMGGLPEGLELPDGLNIPVVEETQDGR